MITTPSGLPRFSRRPILMGGFVALALSLASCKDETPQSVTCNIRVTALAEVAGKLVEGASVMSIRWRPGPRGEMNIDANTEAVALDLDGRGVVYVLNGRIAQSGWSNLGYWAAYLRASVGAKGGQGCRALLHKSAFGLQLPFSMVVQAMASISAMPGAEKPFMTEPVDAAGSNEPAKDADLDFGGLSIGISGHDPLAEKFEAVHPGLAPSSAVGTSPCLPECPSEVPHRVQDLISHRGCGAVLFPGAPVAADGDDGLGAARDDRTMASSRVIGAISRDGGDLFVLGNLRQQVGRQRAVPLTARGELDRAHVAGFR